MTSSSSSAYAFWFFRKQRNGGGPYPYLYAYIGIAPTATAHIRRMEATRRLLLVRDIKRLPNKCYWIIYFSVCWQVPTESHRRVILAAAPYPEKWTVLMPHGPAGCSSPQVVTEKCLSISTHSFPHFSEGIWTPERREIVSGHFRLLSNAVFRLDLITVTFNFELTARHSRRLLFRNFCKLLNNSLRGNSWGSWEKVREISRPVKISTSAAAAADRVHCTAQSRQRDEVDSLSLEEWLIIVPRSESIFDVMSSANERGARTARFHAVFSAGILCVRGLCRLQHACAF